MKPKTTVIVFVILAVVCYTVSVINFTQGEVLGGIGMFLTATTDALMAYAFNRIDDLLKAAAVLVKIIEKLTEDGLELEVTAERDDEDGGDGGADNSGDNGEDAGASDEGKNPIDPPTFEQSQGEVK